MIPVTTLNALFLACTDSCLPIHPVTNFSAVQPGLSAWLRREVR